MKTGGKNNSYVAIEWKVFCLSCDAKDYKYYAFSFKLYKSSVKESKRLRTKCDCPQWAMFVDKVECKKLPVVNCTHENL